MRQLPTALANSPHYITSPRVSDWRMLFPTRAEAQAWLEGYMVTQEYKDAHYRIVSKREFWERRGSEGIEARREEAVR